MKGVAFAGNRKVGIRDFPTLKPGPSAMVMEIDTFGVCRTGLHAYLGPGEGRRT